MNRVPLSYRNPLIRRIWRHRTMAIMLRSARPAIEMRLSGQGASPPVIFRYPEEEMLAGSDATQEPGIESVETRQDDISGRLVPTNPPRHPVEATHPTPVNGTDRGQAEVTTPEKEVFPVVASQPAVKTQALEKTQKGWRLPAIFRKWQERRSAEKISQSSYPTPSLEKNQESQTPSIKPSLIQAIPNQTIGKSEVLEQPPVTSQIRPDSTPLARAVVPSHPIQPQNLETPYIGQTIPAQEPMAPPLSITSPSKATEDYTWRRLQTILQKHEEKQTAEETNVSSMPSPVIEEQPLPAKQEQPSPAIEEQPLPAIEEQPSHLTAQDSLLEKSRMGKTSPSQTETLLQRAPQPSPRASPLPGTEPSKSANQIGQSSSTRPTEMENLTPISTEKVYEPPPGIPSVDRPGYQPLAPSSEEEMKYPPLPPDTGQEPTLITPSEPEDTQLMPLPLEAVWPVQRKERQIPGSQPLPASPSSETPLFNAAPMLPDEEDRLRQVSQKVKTGQPTNSSVEVILPRSPRPAPIQKAAMANLPQSPSPDEGQPSSTPSALEDRPILQSSAGDYTSTSEEPPGEDQNDTNIELMQRDEGASSQIAPPQKATPIPQTTHISSTKSTLHDAAQRLIPTEIGPLPSDLWQLIGQTPPEQPAATIMPESSPPETKTQTTIQATPNPVPPEPRPQAAVEVADYRGLVEPLSRQEIPGDTLPSMAMSQPGRTQATASYPDQLDQAVIQEIPEDTLPSLTSSHIDGTQATASYPDQLDQAGMQEIAKAEKSIAPARRDSVFPQAVIQRQAEGDQTTTPESPAPSGGEETSPQTPELSEEELDKLARQVYDEIRHKLSVERERTRGRM